MKAEDVRSSERRPVAGHQRDVPEIPRPGRVVRPFVTPDERAELLSAGIVTFPPGTDSIPHMHTVEEEVLYVVSGRGALVCDGQPHDLEPGSYVFIPPGVEHFVRVDRSEPITFFYAFSPPVVIGTW
jgi:quercetin dioxygenase-like cupin family protein